MNRDSWTDEWGWILSRALVFWIGIGLQHALGGRNLLLFAALQFCAGAGLNFLWQALLSYAIGLISDPLLMMTECATASIACALLQRLMKEDSQAAGGPLIAGNGAIDSEVAVSLQPVAVGSVGIRQSGVNYLGGLNELREIVDRESPGSVVVNTTDLRGPSGRLLWELQARGVSVQSQALVYEETFRRVSIRRLQPADLILSPALRANSRVMAIQAIYTNLIALSLLLLLSPVLITLSLLIVFAGGGEVFEVTECAGFQKIPFRFFRFQTLLQDGSGLPTLAGRIIRALGFENLPQLINILRGDMTLFGPAPVRRVFAEYLVAKVPFYGHRFSVKPGILGWSQIHAPAGELARLEYDLYYIKEGSPAMDIEILIEALAQWAGRRGKKTA